MFSMSLRKKIVDHVKNVFLKNEKRNINLIGRVNIDILLCNELLLCIAKCFEHGNILNFLFFFLNHENQQRDI